MTFMQQFAQSRGKPIEVDNRLVYALYRRDFRAGLRLRLRWIKSRDRPVQGVSISIKGGTLQVANSKAKDMVLWRDTAPIEIVLSCEGKAVREISLWNCWRDSSGATQAWIGNAGMIIDEIKPDMLRFRCNSMPEITFSDLEFELVFEDQTGA